MNHSVNLFLTLLTLAGCSGAEPTPRTGAPTGANGTGANTSAAVSPEQRLRDLQARDLAETSALANLRDVNQKLCERLQRLRSECSGTYRLIPSAGDSVLACAAGNNAGPDLMVGAFEVEWQADGREYRILADNNWESNPFGNGTTKITWKARLTTSTESPRLIDLGHIIITPKDGASIASTNITRFALRVNGIEALNQGHVTRSTESNGYFVMAMQGILDLRSSAACKVTGDEIRQISDSVQASAQ